MKRCLWLFAFPLAVAAALALLLLSAQAETVRHVSAAPAAPQAANIFTVNGAADNTTANGFLTLREALLLARGGTGASGLNRGLFDGERDQLSGCNFGGSMNNWTISSGCGNGITDTIVFSLPAGVTITLGTTPLPQIDDSAPTTLNGGSLLPRIDASAIGPLHDGLDIQSDSNFVANILIFNAPRYDFVVVGRGNSLHNVWAQGAGAGGIGVSGNGVSIVGAQVGVNLTAGCGAAGNAGDGIDVFGPALLDVIESSDVECSGGDGILMDNGVSFIQVVSSTIGRRFTPNAGNGIRVQGGANRIDLSANLVAGNGANGILISGTTTTAVTIFGNTIENSGASGIRLAAGTHDDSVGAVLSRLNAGNGILLDSGAHANQVLNGTTEHNDRNGIELAGFNTSDNAITGTVMHDNTLDGINTRNSAGPNFWSQISTHDNGGLGIDTHGESDATDDIDLPYPVITSVVRIGSNITLQGVMAHLFADVGAKKIEVYAAAPDPLGFGEGLRYEGTTMTGAGDVWSLSFHDAAPGCYTAFATFNPGGAADAGEFGPNTCSRLFLPLIRR